MVNILRLVRKIHGRKPEGVVAVESGGHHARLVRKDGRLICECPYACTATYEPCAFEGVQ